MIPSRKPDSDTPKSKLSTSYQEQAQEQRSYSSERSESKEKTVGCEGSRSWRIRLKVCLTVKTTPDSDWKAKALVSTFIGEGSLETHLRRIREIS